MQVKLKELQQANNKWQQKYNMLLQKSQNDLIKIRLKQKALNQIIGKLQKQKLQIKKQLGLKVQHLQSQIQGLKNVKNHASKIQLKSPKIQTIKHAEDQTLKKKYEILTQQNIKLEKQLDKLKLSLTNNLHKHQNDKQNIKQKTQIYEDLQQIKQLKKQIFNLKEIMKQTAQRFIQSQSKRQKLQSKCIQWDEANKKNQLTQKPIKNGSNIVQSNKQTIQLKQIIQKFKTQLSLTNNELKTINMKYKLTQQLLLQKNKQLQKKTQQFNQIHQKFLELKQIEEYKTKYQQSQIKCEQFQQENSLLKQMIKSVKNMIKVKENQIERLQKKMNP